MHDVIVIGGGPVGSRAAFKLAGMGHDVLVLEKEAKPGQKVCCTGIVGQECIDTFAIDNALILNRANSAKLFSPAGKMLRIYREATQAYILDRTAFDLSMIKKAKDASAKYQYDTQAENIKFLDDEIEVEAVCQGGKKQFTAKAVVIAAGFGSKLTGRAGLGRIADFAMGAQAEVETVDVDEVEIYFGREIAPGFFAWLVPTSPDKALAGLISQQNTGHYLKKFLSSLASGGKVRSASVELSYGGIPLMPLHRTYGERVLVVGDAAGHVKPTTGGGIYYGLLCADIAADTLHRALQGGDFSRRSIARYQREWRKKLGREFTVGHYARAVYGRLSDRQIDRLFEIIERNKIENILGQADDLSFDWHSRVILRLARKLGFRLTPFAFQVVKSLLSSWRK